MTSESSEDEQRKRTRKIQRFIQQYKAKIGFMLGVSLIITVYYIPPDHTKISCDDPSIRKPYYPDTISVPLLLSVCLGVPFIIMLILERVLPLDAKEQFRQSFRRSWSYVGDLFVGGLLMFFFNDLAKIATSEARPSFWSLCSPNVTEEQCQQEYVMVSWKDCTNPFNMPQRKLVDSMKSFPSGHSSVSVFASLFMIAYIQQRTAVWNNSYRPLAPVIQLSCILWAMICCVTRVLDNKHHWWDVLFGAFLGAFGSFVTVTYFSNWFRREDKATPAQEYPETTSIKGAAT